MIWTAATGKFHYQTQVNISPWTMLEEYFDGHFFVIFIIISIIITTTVPH